MGTQKFNKLNQMLHDEKCFLYLYNLLEPLLAFHIALQISCLTCLNLFFAVNFISDFLMTILFSLFYNLSYFYFIFNIITTLKLSMTKSNETLHLIISILLLLFSSYVTIIKY